MRIGKNDLQLKLMQKNASRRAYSNDYHKLGDLSEKLSKAVKLLVPSMIHDNACLNQKTQVCQVRFLYQEVQIICPKWIRLEVHILLRY